MFAHMQRSSVTWTDGARLGNAAPRCREAPHGAYEAEERTMPAATVSFVASSTRMNAPVARFSA